MKNIKELNCKSKEGFTLRNYQSFPSMEWGPDGGYCADIIYNDLLVGHLHQQGEGGEANWDRNYSISDYDYDEIRKNALSLLKRLDYGYGENSPYSFLKDKTYDKIASSDWESLVTLLEEAHNNYELIKQKFSSKSCNSCAIVTTDCQSVVISLPFTKAEVEGNNNIDKFVKTYISDTYNNFNIKSPYLSIRYVYKYEEYVL